MTTDRTSGRLRTSAGASSSVGLGTKLRRMREDAGRSQAAIATGVRITQAHLSADRGWQRRAEPRGADGDRGGARAATCRCACSRRPGRGSAIGLQVAMSEALLASLHPRWRAATGGARLPAGPRRDRPRADGRDGATSSCRPSCSAELRRVEQQIRWSVAEGRCAGVDAGVRRRPRQPPAGRAQHGCDARDRREPRPDAWPRPTRRRAADAIASSHRRRPVAGRRHVVGERRARRGDGSSMGRPAGSRSGDSIVR